jgi:archaellum component FlaC
LEITANSNSFITVNPENFDELKSWYKSTDFVLPNKDKSSEHEKKEEICSNERKRRVDQIIQEQNEVENNIKRLKMEFDAAELKKRRLEDELKLYV